jgi:hypothetical protein
MNTVARTPKTRKPSKPSRTLRLYPGSPMLLEMTIGKDSFSYWLRQLPSDFGSAYELRKSIAEGSETYHVLLHGPHGHSCECKGHLRWGHRTVCKHVACLLALGDEGKLAAAPGRKKNTPANLAEVNGQAAARPAVTLEDL